MTGAAGSSMDYNWGVNAGESNIPDMVWQGAMNSYGTVQPTVRNQLFILF